MVSFGPVTKKQFKLIPTGEYVFVLDDVGTTEGDYGERMVWDFFVAEKESPTDYLTKDDGSVHTLKFWTDVEVTLGSRQLEWISALTGRTFGEDDELPDGGELLSKRMLAYLTHYTPKRGKNKGIAREDIVMGSAKPFALPRSKSNGAAKPSAPPAESDDDKAALIAEIKKNIRRAAILDIDAAAAWSDVDLDRLSMTDLENGLASIKEAIEGEEAA